MDAENSETGGKPPRKGGRKSAGYHHGDLKRELVTAARRILEEEGLAALSLRGVARAAGVSQAAPYHHFADKDQLLAAIATEGFAGLSAAMAGYSDGAKDAGGRMEGLGVGYVVFAWQNPELFRLMHGRYFEDIDKFVELITVASESYEMLVNGVRGCMPGRSEADVDIACKASWSLVHGLSSLIIDKRFEVGDTVKDVEALARAVVRQQPVGAARR